MRTQPIFGEPAKGSLGGVRSRSPEESCTHFRKIFHRSKFKKKVNEENSPSQNMQESASAVVVAPRPSRLPRSLELSPNLPARAALTRDDSTPAAASGVTELALTGAYRGGL